MNRILLATGVTLTACALAQNPSAAPAPSFEVASVKPAAPMTAGKMMVRMGNNDPGRLDYGNVSLRDLIREAYQIKDYQIVGPAWLESERFDVVAKLPDGAPTEQKWPMLQALLAERFKLEAHREKKDLPAYALTVAKGGIKMKEFVEAPEDTSGPSAGGGRGAFEGGPIKFGADGMPKLPGGRAGMMMMGFGRLKAQGIPISNLADMLSRQLDKPVLDETGVAGKYDVSLNWTPEPGEGGGLMGLKIMAEHAAAGPPPSGGGDGKVVDPAAAAPPLPIALQQQLGLKLEPKKLPLDILVVDRVEKVPTEN